MGMYHKCIGEPIYNNVFFKVCQERLNEALGNGLAPKHLTAFFKELYFAQDRSLTTRQSNARSLQALELGVLKPRQDLYVFILNNWIKHIFIPYLEQRLAASILIFGVGRVFSAYSNAGVQQCTDADLNIVVKDNVSNTDLAKLHYAVELLQEKSKELFDIAIEVNSAFTILRLQDIRSRLASANPHERTAAALFYKGNAESMFVLHDNPELRQDLLATVQPLPDRLLFENFLGNNLTKPTLMRLRTAQTRLAILSDKTHQEEFVAAVIGARDFGLQCRSLGAAHPGVYPPHWYFSMKYTVNRIYDYVSAMCNKGYALADLGFTDSADPDYHFICQAHKVMLVLQDLTLKNLETFSARIDPSYMSAERFTNFMNAPRSTFAEDFAGLVLHAQLLRQSQQNKYFDLEAAIAEKRLRCITGPRQYVGFLAKQFGFDFQELEHDAFGVTVATPYLPSDLGFLVFSAIETRLTKILDTKLITAVELIET